MKTDFDGIRTADAPGLGNGSARLAPAPFTAEWWQSAEMRRLKMQALRRAAGRCERCGEPEQKLIARLNQRHNSHSLSINPFFFWFAAAILEFLLRIIGVYLSGSSSEEYLWMHSILIQIQGYSIWQHFIFGNTYCTKKEKLLLWYFCTLHKNTTIRIFLSFLKNFFQSLETLKKLFRNPVFCV